MQTQTPATTERPELRAGSDEAAPPVSLCWVFDPLSGQHFEFCQSDGGAVVERLAPRPQAGRKAP